MVKSATPLFICAVFVVVACKDSLTPTGPSAAAKPTKSKAAVAPVKAAVAKPAVKTVDTSGWDTAVKTDYALLLKLPESKKDEIIQALGRLAKKGIASREAMLALSDNPALPERQRAMGGIFYASYFRFQLPELVKLLSSANPFTARQAAYLMSKYGGPEARAKMLAFAAGTKNRGLAKNIDRQLGKMRSTALPPRALEKLHALVFAETGEKKKLAAVILAEDFGKIAEAELLEVHQGPLSNKETQMNAAFALVTSNKKNVEKLKLYCNRKYRKFLRYSAMKELGNNGAAGKAVLKEFLKVKDEPLKPHIERFINEGGN